jgi:hypothetical protein
MKRTGGGAQEVETFLDIQQLSEIPGNHMFSPKTCVYRKPKPERSGDEVRPRGRVNL